MEDKDELDETLCEISELLESMLIRVPRINYDFNSLEAEGSEDGRD